ncbi:glycosyltransferase [Exiguobacterium acetylicum]|uniref:glycosyltransferase n=1 Tax=Exiguobacterium acetylicum TaxID=41170 RepID=UPI0034D65393
MVKEQAKILVLWENGKYTEAYNLIFDLLKKNPQDLILKVYLAVFAKVVGNEELGNYYINLIGENIFIKKINENEKLLKFLVSNSIEKSKWDNYRRVRNQNEINRFSVTAPLCNGNVLEVGCANGDLSKHIAMYADNLYGIDIDPVAIELARYKVFNLGLKNCFFTTRDGSDLSVFNKEFDTVVLAEVLEHVSYPEKFIEEAIKVCKPGGKVIISVPKGYRIPDPDHINIFNKQTLTELITKVTTFEVYWVETVPEPWLMCCISLPEEKKQLVNDKKDMFFLPLHQQEILDESEKVSVIIPTYNRSEYLKFALDSVLNQTYSNIEIIVVNDGSTDDTENILKNYKDSIKYVYKENGGKSTAINVGMSLVSGKYVCILDDDDIALSKKIELQVRKFQKNKNLGLIHTSATYFKEVDKDFIHLGMYDANKFNKKNALDLHLLGNIFFTPTVMVRKECYDKVGSWDETMIRAQDYDMWMRISRYFETDSLPVTTLQYRIHDGKRGTVNEPILKDELNNSTFKYSRRVLRKMHDIPINEIFRDVNFGEKNFAPIVESYLERAFYMAQNSLFKECAIDLESAKAISVGNKINNLSFSYKGLQLIKNFEEIISESQNPKIVMNGLYFVKMVKSTNNS